LPGLSFLLTFLPFTRQGLFVPAKRLQAGFSNFRQNKKVEKIFKNREKTP